VAGAALLTSAGFFAFGRYVRPETLFAAALAWGFTLVLSGLVDARRVRVVAGFAAFGVAALAKDPLGVAGPLLTLGAALALAGRARPLGRWLPWSGVLLLALLGFGWWALVEWRTPGFVWYTVVDNHVLNVVGARQLPDEDVPLSAGEFLTVALLGAAPWALAAGVALWALLRRRAWREPRELPWTALALWIGVVLVGTTLSSFRLPHYGLPAYFAIALLAARGWEEQGGRGLPVAHALLFAAFALACGLLATTGGARLMESVLGATDVATRKSAVAGQAAPLPAVSAFRPLLIDTALAFAAGALALGAWAAAFRRLGPRARRAAPLIVVATMLLVLPSVATALALVASHRAVRGVALELARRATPEDLVAHEGPIENSGALEWYSGRRAVIVDGRRSVLAFGARRPEARDLFWDGARLRDAWLGGRRVWVVSVRAPEQSVVAGLPRARLVAAAGGRWLWVNEPP
jgi:4-amino-4-deoxy-L-arabinose transferase-like glycosyltransferase